MTDTTDKDFAESIRDRLIKQLTAANEQLEQFAYIASHDLREPLRIILCFTELLTKEYGSRLDEQARQYMEINRHAARKMDAIITDLLEFGRLGQSPDRTTEVDCNDSLQQAIDALSEPIAISQATITHAPLPTLTANPVRLSRVFQNLISNALKYQSPGNAPLIHVASADKGDHWQFTLTDNGIGFKGEYKEIIFHPFKRLHNEQDYAGTGMGLAICKRIIESSGGTIWANSDYGSGSEFCFTLPKVIPQEDS